MRQSKNKKIAIKAVIIVSEPIGTLADTIVSIKCITSEKKGWISREHSFDGSLGTTLNSASAGDGRGH